MIQIEKLLLRKFCSSILREIGTNKETRQSTVDAMMHASEHGIDSHGIRLFDHYVRGFQGGRLNKNPDAKFFISNNATGIFDADNGHGAFAMFKALEHTKKLALDNGISAVGIKNSSHFGPAGAYAIKGARMELITLIFGNSDSFVSLFDGRESFHGTNPIAVSVPTSDKHPWLLDMATSSIPYNKIELHRSLNRNLPLGAAINQKGIPTANPHLAKTLSPLGGKNFGYKGAGLAGVAEIFSSVLTGMKLSPDIPSMLGPDFKNPRKLGAFIICINPFSFVDKEIYYSAITRYLLLLRNSNPSTGKKVLAPGDREWKIFEEREKKGIPIDPKTENNFIALSKKYNISIPW